MQPTYRNALTFERDSVTRFLSVGFFLLQKAPPGTLGQFNFLPKIHRDRYPVLNKKSAKRCMITLRNGNLAVYLTPRNGDSAVYLTLQS